MSDYQQAQQQLTEMIDYLRTHQSTDCAAAEREDDDLVRLSLQQRILTPNDSTTIERIDQYYKKFFAEQTGVGLFPIPNIAGYPTATARRYTSPNGKSDTAKVHWQTHHTPKKPSQGCPLQSKAV